MIAPDDCAVSVLSHKQCHLGEGPTYDVRTGSLFWFDILEKRLHSLNLETGHTMETTLPLIGSAIFSVDDDRQLVLMENGFHVRYRATGVMSLVIPVEADNAATRSNDARAHPCGAVWFGTMGRKAETGAGAIYHMYKGHVTKLFANITIPNAICFSPDGSIAYFADTMKAKLMRVLIDPVTALPLGEPQLFYDHKGGAGGIDGAVVDGDGVIWNTRWGTGEVVALSPDGKQLRSINLPAKQTSCPAFCGPNLSIMAVTSAYEGYDEAAKAADPECGKTFLIEGPFKGRAEPDVGF